MTVSTRRVATLVLTGLLSLGLTACSEAQGEPQPEGPSPSQSEGAETPASEAPTPPTRSGDDDRWDFEAATQIEESVYKALTTDDLLITLDGSAIRMRDGSGEVVGQVKPAKKRNYADMRLDGDRLLVLEQDLSEAVPELTLGAVDIAAAKTGDQVSWALPAFRDGMASARLRGRAGALTIVEVAAKQPSTTHAVTAVDLASGEAVWTKADTSVLAVTGDGVLVNTFEGRSPAVAFVATDGSTSWTALSGGEPDNGFLVGVSGTEAVVGHTGDGGTMLSTLSLTDGSVVGDPVEARARRYGCTPAEDEIAICSLANSELVAWDLGAGEELWALPSGDTPSMTLRHVADGLAYGNLADGGWMAVDIRSGEQQLSGGGSAPLALNEHGAYFNDGAGRQWVPNAG